MKKADNKTYRKSKQRERILEVLSTTGIHPTADWIYGKLKKEYPQLSLGTVYRNLTILIEQGFVKKIHFGSTFDRFEANSKQHYHLICDSCGTILDYNIPIYDHLNNKANQQTNFNIHYHKLDFFGKCQDCKDK